MTHVMACIDGSSASPTVCDYATWASRRLDAPLTLLHVLDDARYPVETNLTGNIGLGSRENLLQELATLDEQRARLALEQGHLMLEEARLRAQQAGIEKPLLRQRHGNLVDGLQELESDIRLLVIGLHGATTGSQHMQIGSHLESVIRVLHKPILITPQRYTEPTCAMLAFDGSATTRKCVDMLAGSPLLRGLPLHVVMVGNDTNESREQLAWAKQALVSAGYDITAAIRHGEVEPTLHAYQAEHKIDLMVMGAYGHSRIRQFLVGSTTTHMLRTALSAMLILR